MTRLQTFCLALLSSTLLASCSVGPDYLKPATALPANFKEAEGWKIASPKDLVSRGDWWQMFCDSELNALEAQVDINNQNIKVAEARFRQAQAFVAQARAGFFPSVDISGGATRGQSATRSTGNNYNAGLSAAWEVDIWGRIRRTVEANKASEAASAADLEAAKLSAQSELAISYVSLRIADEQKRLLDETVQAYSKSLELTDNLYQSGIQTRSDFLQAKVQLESAKAQAVDVNVQRTAYEHAIAVLIGKAPAEFTLPAINSVPQVPSPPVTVPSTVLERRPDVAASERRAASANAQIGVAEAAFYPDLSLSATISYASSSLGNVFSAPARVWSLGPSVVMNLFDAGLRRAQTNEAIAFYDETVATYRQTVLGAFQEVEDNLSALKTLNEEQEIRNTALQDAKASTEVISNQYREGITSYLNVVTAQTTELNNALSALAVRKLRLTTSINLIKALGGKWETPAAGEVTKEEVKAAVSVVPAPPAAVPLPVQVAPATPADPLKLAPPKPAVP